jgi:ribonuclease D
VPHWITDPAALDALIAAPPATIGLDTEFVRERTYWPQLALVQIAAGDEIFLVDPLAPGIPAALAKLLSDTRVLKIMHSASEDLVALKYACNALPQPLFDTQVAAALCGVAAGIGYQRLLQELLDISVDKGETRSDWLRRPLSPSQLHYAADDVLHLDALHRTLTARLETQDRMAWLEEDCARMLNNAAQDEGERWPHLGMRSAQFLERDGQIRLLRLLRWRDAYARDHDRPRRRPRPPGLQTPAAGGGRTQRRTGPTRRRPGLAALDRSPAGRRGLARGAVRLAPRPARNPIGAIAHDDWRPLIGLRILATSSRGAVAQLGERHVRIVEVRGSIPLRSTIR